MTCRYTGRVALDTATNDTVDAAAPEPVAVLLHRRLVLRALGRHLSRGPLRVLHCGPDVGLAVELARLGCDVSAVDVDLHPGSSGGEDERALHVRVREALRRVGGPDRGVGVRPGARTPVTRLAAEWGAQEFDLVCCHGVVPYVPALRPALRALADVVRPGGLVSLDGLNAAGLGMYYAQMRMLGMPGVWGPLLRAVDGLGRGLRAEVVVGEGERPRWAEYVVDVENLLAQVGVVKVALHGLRGATDLSDEELEQRRGHLAEILEREWAHGLLGSYRVFGRGYHLIGRRES